MRVPHSGTRVLQTSLESRGMDSSKAVERARSASKVREGRKRERSLAVQKRGTGAADMEVDGAEPEAKKRVHSKPSRSMSRGTPLREPCIKTRQGQQLIGKKRKEVRMPTNRVETIGWKQRLRGWRFMLHCPSHVPCSINLCSFRSLKVLVSAHSEGGHQGCSSTEQGMEDGGHCTTQTQSSRQSRRVGSCHPHQDA